jgi:hypothetical protein
MSIDATLTILGPHRVADWAFDNREDYVRACEEEEALIPRLEAELSRQIGRETHLPASLLTIEPTDGDDGENRCEVVGGSEGLKWLQESIESYTAARTVGSRRTDQRRYFRHALEHDAVTGIFLPVDFSNPFTIEHRGDLVSVGSLPRLCAELRIWKATIFLFHMEKNPDVAPVWREYCENLASMTDLALQKGKAVELI